MNTMLHNLENSRLDYFALPLEDTRVVYQMYDIFNPGQLREAGGNGIKARQFFEKAKVGPLLEFGEMAYLKLV